MTSLGISADELRESIGGLLDADASIAVLRAPPEQLAAWQHELWSKMGALGWFGLGVDCRYGGLGLGFRELAILYEELGRCLIPLPVLPTLLAIEGIARCGSEEQRTQWLPLLAAGSVRAALALPMGTDPVPQLAKDGSLTGTVPNVLFANGVDELMLPVQDAQDGTLHLAMLSAANAQVEIHPHPLIDLTRTLCEVRLNGAIAVPERLLRLDEQAWSALLDHAGAAVACDAAGGAARILEATVEYLGTRRQFDRPIGSFQALKHRAATWKIRVEGVRALVHHTAELVADDEAGRSAVVSCAKVSACDAYVAIAGDAVQLHGGIGFTWEHHCHRYLKRAKLNAVLFGGAIQHRERAAALAFADALGRRRGRDQFMSVLGDQLVVDRNRASGAGR